MKNQLDPITSNSTISILAADIAEKFKPLLAAGQITQIDLAMIAQQAIDRSAAKESLESLELSESVCCDLFKDLKSYGDQSRRAQLTSVSNRAQSAISKAKGLQ